MAQHPSQQSHLQLKPPDRLVGPVEGSRVLLALSSRLSFPRKWESRVSSSGRFCFWAIILFFALQSSIGFAQTEFQGEVSGQWTSDGNQFIVEDSTLVPEGESLELREGVEVFFEEGQGLYVFGTLNATGTEEDSVRIRVNNSLQIMYFV